MKKRFFKFFVCFALILGVMFSSIASFILNFKVNAYTQSYQPFNYMVVFCEKAGVNEYIGNVLSYIDTTGIPTTLVRENVSFYSNVNYNFDIIYLCKLEPDGIEYNINDNYIIPLDDFIKMGYDQYYSDGYDVGINSTNITEVYNNGYNTGVNDRNNYYENKIADIETEYQNQNQTFYHNGYNDGVNDGYSQAMQEVEEEEVNQATIGFKFTNLLNTIFMFPIRILKEGMDINIFGINLGGIILAVLAFSVISLVIGLFMKGRN